MTYTNQYQKRKSIVFGKALEIYEMYKSELMDQLERREITSKQYEIMIKNKAKELDL